MHAAYETSTPEVYTRFIEVFWLIVEFLIFDFYCQCGWNLYVYLLMCVPSFSSLRGTYVYNLIISAFSGASLGAAPARRLFMRRNFLI